MWFVPPPKDHGPNPFLAPFIPCSGQAKKGRSTWVYPRLAVAAWWWWWWWWLARIDRVPVAGHVVPDVVRAADKGVILDDTAESGGSQRQGAGTPLDVSDHRAAGDVGLITPEEPLARPRDVLPTRLAGIGNGQMGHVRTLVQPHSGAQRCCTRSVRKYHGQRNCGQRQKAFAFHLASLPRRSSADRGFPLLRHSDSRQVLPVVSTSSDPDLSAHGHELEISSTTEVNPYLQCWRSRTPNLAHSTSPSMSRLPGSGRNQPHPSVDRSGQRQK